MRKKKVAIFVDWENIRKGIFEAAETGLSKKVDYNDVDNVLKFFYAFLDLKKEEIYRTFVYLCEPYGGTIGTTDYKTTPTYIKAKEFIENLQVKDHIATRMGKLVIRGSDRNNKPIFVQKQVDMLLGLDIAHVSYNKLADRILILTVDTDIVPAMKTARINGLQVIWGYCPDVESGQKSNLPKDLKKHADLIRPIDFSSIFP